MKKFLAAVYFEIASHLEYIAAYTVAYPDNIQGLLNAEDRSVLLERLEAMLKECDGCGLDFSACQARRMVKLVSDATCTHGQVSGAAVVLRDRFLDELHLRLFLYIAPGKAKYFEEAHPFGESVSNAFPSAVQDIHEAGKCLAVARHTACVFHLMRVMEVGLKTLARALGIPYAPSWESYLNQIQTKIGAKHKTKGVRWKRDEPFFRDVAGDLQAVKIAWRNPTMHIVRRYDEDEAEDVFRAVAAFMRRLATRFPVPR